VFLFLQTGHLQPIILAKKEQSNIRNLHCPVKPIFSIYLPTSFQKDLIILSIFTAITLDFGLLLKKPINRVSYRLAQKAKGSRLIH